MITKEKIPWSVIKFSQLILKGNVWRSVWRICMLILGLEGLMSCCFYQFIISLFLRTPVFNNWAVLPWGEVKCWSFSFSLFSGLLWNCTENNADYSRKAPASPNDWCKLTNHWCHSLFFHPPLLGHFFY